MEILTQKRTRLTVARTSVDVSDAAWAKWLNYPAVKVRPVPAYAEQPVTA